jgi:hypothetical protein
LNIVAVRRSIINRNLYTRTNWVLELECMLSPCRLTVFATVKVAVFVPHEPCIGDKGSPNWLPKRRGGGD